VNGTKSKSEQINIYVGVYFIYLMFYLKLPLVTYSSQRSWLASTTVCPYLGCFSDAVCFNGMVLRSCVWIWRASKTYAYIACLYDAMYLHCVSWRCIFIRRVFTTLCVCCAFIMICAYMIWMTTTSAYVVCPLQNVLISGVLWQRSELMWCAIKLYTCKIWGFHGDDYEKWRLLGCYAVWLRASVASYSKRCS
jgi:hypothetical protein